MESPTFLDSRVSDRVSFFSQKCVSPCYANFLSGLVLRAGGDRRKKKETNTKMTKLFFPFLRQAFIVSSRDFCYVS